jgi:NADPH:quinone reductase-like Zn-dependent oxidoreductase
MRVMTIRAPASLDNLHVTERKDPGRPGPGEVRVRIHASSLNYHDLGVVTGRIPTADGRIPMADGAGVVEEIGEGVTEFAAGQNVVSCFFPRWIDGEPPFGDFSTVPGDGVDGYACPVVVHPATWFTAAPAGWSPAEAATITTAGLTAWRALVVEGSIKPGDTVLTLGSGGVAVFAVQLARAMGATVISTSSSDEKLERLRALGADHLINYTRNPDWGVRAREFTGGRGVDIVVDTAGPLTLPQSIAAVRVGGRIALIGSITGRAGEIPTSQLMLKQARLQGLIVGNRRQQADFVRGLERTMIRPVISRTYPLQELAEAFRFEQTGRHFGKISIEV